MLHYKNRLVTALSLDPQGITGILLAKGLISKNTEAQMQLCFTSQEKATIIVDSVTRKIALDPKYFTEFLDALLKQAWTQDIMEVLLSFSRSGLKHVKTGTNTQHLSDITHEQKSISTNNSEHESEGISAVSYASRNLPHRIMLRYNDKLVTALSHDPHGISRLLLAKGLIPEHTVAQMQQPSTPREKATILVATIRQRIQNAPNQFQKFLDILSKKSWTKDLAETLHAESSGENLLSESDLRILNIVLVEHLPKLKGIGLDLDHNITLFITKQEVIKCLQQVGQQSLADILSKYQGKNNVDTSRIECYTCLSICQCILHAMLSTSPLSCLFNYFFYISY